jgi:hypothetical protein
MEGTGAAAISATLVHDLATQSGLKDSS